MNRAGAVALAVAALSALLAVVAPAAGAEVSREAQVEAELERLQNDISETMAAEARVLAELRVSQRNRKALDAKVAALDVSLAAAQAELAAVTAQLDQATAAALAAARQVDEARQALEDATALLKEQAINAYIRFGTGPSIPKVVRTIEDVNEVPRVVALAGTVTGNQAVEVDRHRRIRAELTELELQSNAARAALATDRERVAQQKTQIEADRATQAAARAEARAEEATESRLLAQLQASRAEDEARIRELQASSDSITALLRKLQAGQPAAPSGKGILGYPLASPVVTSTFGYRTHPIFGDQRLHAGIDLKAGTGTPILAAADGTVVYAGTMRGYGNVVIIDHGRSLATLYAHQSRVAVAVGRSVRKGQVVGSVGSSGYATGPHLHFEVRALGAPVDPRRYL